jgi:hypothetical protein
MDNVVRADQDIRRAAVSAWIRKSAVKRAKMGMDFI